MPVNVPEAPVMFPLNAALPLLSILNCSDAIAPVDKVNLVPAVVNVLPSEVPDKLLEEIVPVVILAPSITVVPLEPKSSASKGVRLLFWSSCKVPQLKVTTPVKLVCWTTFEYETDIVEYPALLSVP